MTVLLCLVLLTDAGASPRQDPKPAAAPTVENRVEAPTSAEEAATLSRIRRKLARPPALRTASDKPVYRVEIFGRNPTIEEILGPDYLKGPVAGGAAMTHREFLSMVTPKDVTGFAAFSNGEAFTVAATAIALQWGLQKAIRKLADAKKDHDVAAARREVQDALNALAKARQRAGLPPQ